MTCVPEREQTPRVVVVDDDESVRESLPELLRSFGLTVYAFPSAEEFLLSSALTGTHCLLLDVAMPGMSGTELQRTLLQRGHDIPIVFITAHADEQLRGECLRGGALDCLLKPFSEDALVRAVRIAIGTSRGGTDVQCLP